VVDFKNKGVDRDINQAIHKYLEFDTPFGIHTHTHTRIFFNQTSNIFKIFSLHFVFIKNKGLDIDIQVLIYIL
jgi:hypothetical protein